MRPEDDAIVAEVALRRGWVDRETLGRALELQTAASAIELDERLLDILVAKRFITDRQARDLEEEIGLGRLAQAEHCEEIEGYRILGKLGQGGMGAVFKAVERSTTRLVALKVLSPELAREPQLVERFTREAKAIGRVSHPNVVGGLAAGRSGDYHYYAMDYVEGQDLYDALADGPLPIERVLDVAAQMAGALAHIESLGLVHRDIKPSNIIVTADGTARLCDLGLARAPEDPSVTDTGIPIGTPHYAAPELAMGSKDVDIRADIYALGATLYHLATGSYPFGAESGASLLLKHIQERLRPPIELRPDMPRGLNGLICRMMAKKPGKRFQSPQELLRAVASVREILEAARGSALPTIAPVGAVAPPEASPEAPALPAIAPVEELPPAAPSDGPPQPAEAAAEEPAAAARDPWRGVVGSLPWAVTFAVLIAVLAGAVLWAVRSRGRRAARPPGESGEPHADTSTGTGAGEEPRPARPPGAAEDEEAWRRLAAEAVEFDKAHPKAHGAALLALRRAALAAGDPVVEQELETRLAARRRALDKGAGRELESLTQQLQACRAADRFGAALAACAAFPSEFRHGLVGERLGAQVAALGAQAERRYIELATTGALLLRQHRLADAARSYEQIGALGIPWIRQAGGSLLAAAVPYAEAEQRRVDEMEKRRAVDKRRRAAGRLSKPFARVHAQLRQRDYAKALELCLAARRAHGARELAAALERLDARVRLLLGVWEALRASPPTLQGKPFRVHGIAGKVAGVSGTAENPQLTVRIGSGSSQRSYHQALRRLSGEQLAQLVGWALEKEPEPARSVKLAAWQLAEGDHAQARALLERAKARGADTGTLRMELDAAATVAAALAARDKRDWKKARLLLEAALDQYAATSTVVLEHARLMAALSACLGSLGENLPLGPLKAAPLPLALRRLVLLPDARLSSTAPADLLDAYRGQPLERGSPAVVGLDGWTDYTVELRWTAERGGSFVALFRLSEPAPGRFAYYFVRYDGRRLVLGRTGVAGTVELAQCACRTLGGRGEHRLVLSASGAELVADADRTYRLRASDRALPRGNIALATRDAVLRIHQLVVFFPESS